MGINAGFETGDFTGWNPSPFPADDSFNFPIINEPGYNSEYNAFLSGGWSIEPVYIQKDLVLVPGITYTMSFAYNFYNVEPSSSSQSFVVTLSGAEANDEPIDYTISTTPPNMVDSIGNVLGDWYTVTLPQFVAMSTDYSLYIQSSSSYDENAVALDSFQLLASMPSPPSASTVAPVNEMGSNAGFEDGDYSGWYTSQDQNDGPPTQMTITSPGYESDYAAYLFGGDQGGADYLDLSFGLIPGTSYTFSFAYNLNVNREFSTLTLSGMIRANDVEDQPVSFSIGYNTPALLDTNNNQPGAWYIMSFPSFVAAGDSYHISMMLEADGNETGVYLDDFQLVASAPTSSSVAPTAVYTTTTVT